MALSPFALTGLEYATNSCKSLVISLALIEGALTVDDAVRKARLEVVFQTQRFGVVEWAHTLEECDTTARLAAAALFVRWSERVPLNAESEN